jgi:hypothetical protein
MLDSIDSDQRTTFLWDIHERIQLVAWMVICKLIVTFLARKENGYTS